MSTDVGFEFTHQLSNREHLLNTTVNMLTVSIKKNSRYGNKKDLGKLLNIFLKNEIDQPTIVPINTPLKLLATTRLKAS